MSAKKYSTLLLATTLGLLTTTTGCEQKPPPPGASKEEPAAVEQVQIDEPDASDASAGKAALIQLGATLVEDSQGNVTEVSLAQCKVTDSALVHLAELSKLRKLHLEGTQVTDAGMRHLFVLRELRLVNLGETPVTAKGRGALRKKLPRALVFPLELETPLSAPGEFLNRMVESHKGMKRIPPVYLSEGHKALCRVMVGDRMPELTLKRPDGNEGRLADHYGKTLTVVFFWSAERREALELLIDMDRDVARPFANRGVHVVGVSVGGETKETKRLLSESEATFTNLLDDDQSEFAKVGSQRLPRVYLVNSQGKILWFDIGYSISTRRDLLGSIIYLLGSE